MRELGPHTRLGEVDWAIAREDARLPSDVLLRRTDLGFDAGAAAVDAVLSRMAERLGWSADERCAARAEWDAAHARLHAWRHASYASTGDNHLSTVLTSTPLRRA
jgi:glycerol-3-phosphate dehydrogenase